MTKNRSDFIIDRLCDNNFEAYIVGGYVRDLFLGIKSNDEDVVTSATPNIIEKIFKDRKIKSVGKSFNVLIVDDIEVATYRKDQYKGLSDKNVDITYADNIYEDLERRDLTINSIAYCSKTGDIIDPFNGINDIKNKIIKFTGDPEKRILEDPNRIIRACRFKALINGEFDLKTKESLINNAHLLMEFVDKERMKLEILKAMKIQKASLFFKALREIDALQYIFESLDNTFDYNEKEDHGKYHDESIIDHCLMCGDNISTKKPLIKLAGYLHDIGKPLTCKLEDGNMCFHGHEKIGECYAEIDLQKLKFSNKEIQYIKSLIGLHMRNFKTPSAIRRTLNKLDEVGINWKDLNRLKMADCKSNLKKNGYSKERIKEISINVFNELYKKESVNKFKDLKITGNEIMKILNIKPGKLVGEIKNNLFELVLEIPELNNKEKLKQIIMENY